MNTTSAIERAAERLERASMQRTACSPIRDLVAIDDLESAYAIQRRNIAHRLSAGSVISGRKIGLTNPAVQRQLGVDQPDFGTLLDSMGYPTGATIDASSLLQPRIEAEIAFVLKSDLAAPLHTDIQLETVRDAIEYAVASLEVVDSRIEGWDITFVDTVADNASSGAYVLGDNRVRLDELDTVVERMQLSENGEPKSAGCGADCLGDPLLALCWLANTVARLGEPLRAGEIVLSGALGPMIPVRSGSVIQAEFSSLGSVSVEFG